MPRSVARSRFPTLVLPLAVALAVVSTASPAKERPVHPAACTAGKTIKIGAAQNGKTIDATLGDRIRVVLRGASGTGYSWQLQPPGNAALATDGLNVAATPARPGGPATQVFSLRAAVVGTQTLTFAYLRPWERGKPPARSISVTIRVAGC